MVEDPASTHSASTQIVMWERAGLAAGTAWTDSMFQPRAVSTFKTRIKTPGWFCANTDK
jgi:hypothetical protein